MRTAEGGAALTCLMAALKAPRTAAAPPQSLFIPGMVVWKGHKEREWMLTCGAHCQVPTAHTEPKKLPLVKWLLQWDRMAKGDGLFLLEQSFGGYLMNQRWEGMGTRGTVAWLLRHCHPGPSLGLPSTPGVCLHRPSLPLCPASLPDATTEAAVL